MKKLNVVGMLLVLMGCGGGGNNNSSPSIPLTAKITSSQLKFSGSVVTLDGSQSTGNMISYEWTIVSSPSGSIASLTNSTTAKPSVTADLPGQYSIKLVVTDSKTASSANTSILLTANVPPTDLVVIGNSLTRHGQLPTVDWYGDWGMAASVSSKDFSHLVSTSLNLPLSAAINFSTLETSPITVLDSDILSIVAPVKQSSMVVVELGDNVSTLEVFSPQYSKLLDSVSQARLLVCTSTWWKDINKDAVIQAACAAHGGQYVFIGDIYTDPTNQDKQGVQFSNAGVNAHPHDWSMAKIAERIVAVSH